MLLLLLLYLFITFVCLWSGCIFYAVINNNDNSTKTGNGSLINYLVTGLIVCACFSQLAVLIMPLNELVIAAYLILLIIISFFFRYGLYQQLSVLTRMFSGTLHRYTIAGSLLFVLMIVILNAGPAIMDDTDSYHLPMVKWVDQYGTVPGIANLHVRFGLNSSWFVLAGFFLSDTGTTACLALNGLLSVWLGVFLIDRITGFLQATSARASMATGIAALFIFLLALFAWPLFRGNAASLNYDFITTAVVLVLLFQVLSGKNMQYELFIWPCFLFTVRIINYPLLLLSMLMLLMLWRSRQSKQIFFLLLAGAILVIPFLVRTTVLSGYPFFPLQFPFRGMGDWKADPAVMSQYVEYTRAFNRVNEQHQPIETTLQLSFPGWISAWYRYLFNFDKVIVTLATASVVYLLFRQRDLKNRISVSARWIFAACCAQLISWFIVSPDPRFAYGPLLCMIAFAVMILPAAISNVVRKLMSVAFLLVLAGILIYTVRKPLQRTEYRNWVRPHPVPIPEYRMHTINEIDFYIPLRIDGNWNPRCYNTTLPCLYTIQPGLKPRGKHIQQGFTIQQSRDR